MKILATSLVLMLTLSIIFASANDAFALSKPKVASLSLTKTADEMLVLPGTMVTYTYTATNTGTLPLICRSTATTGLVDSAFGPIPIPNTTILVGQTRVFTVTKTITDTTMNMATLTCKTDSNVLVSATSNKVTVEVFQPSVEVTKDGDTLSKVGDDVTYDFTITNTGTANSPALILDTVTDTLLGNLAAPAPAACDSLAPGASCLFSVPRTVMAGDPDPLPNTVTVHYHSDGFVNDVTDSDSHSVNLFQPSVQVEKEGDTTVNVGDDVTYDFTITNTGSADSPVLILVFVTDSVFGNLAGDAPPACDSLAPGASCLFSVMRTALITDPNPLVNTVTVNYHPDGFPNDVTDSDSHSVTIIKTLSIDVNKIADPSLIEAGETVTYTVDITNTGQVIVNGIQCTDDYATPNDSGDDIDVDALMGGPFSLNPGQSKSFTYQKDIFMDSKNVVQCMGFGPDNTPVGDMAMARVTVLFVGGSYMPIESTALLLAGIQNTAAWLVPAIAGLAGIGLYLVKFRFRNN